MDFGFGSERVEDGFLPRFHRRVIAKPSPPSRSLVQPSTSLSLGLGVTGRLRPSFLFPLSPGLALPVAPVLKRGATAEAAAYLASSSSSKASTADGPSGIPENRTASRRSSAYASWATDPEKPRSSSWHAADCFDSAPQPSSGSTSAPTSPTEAALQLDEPVQLAREHCEGRGQRLSRERTEMLEAARRREAELHRQRAEKDAWQVAALAERRREAAARRKQVVEGRQREVEAQRRREEVEQCHRREKRAAYLAQQHSEEGRAACASDLHGDVLHLVLRFLDARALLQSAMGIRELWHSAAKDDELWLALCRQDWATKVLRYHLTPEKQATLISKPYGPPSWFDAYREAEEDGAREFIFRDELTRLTFQFRWRRWVEQVASPAFTFEEDNFTSGHPFNTRFPWVLDDLGVGIQWGPAEDMFPKGFVFRLADWSWRIENISGVLTEADTTIPPTSSVLPEGNQGMAVGPGFADTREQPEGIAQFMN